LPSRRDGRCESSDPLSGLLARIERLEACEACRTTFNEYLHHLDGGFTEDLLDVFSQDAHLEVVDLPPGSGKDVDFRGREEIRPLYAAHAGSPSRHHLADVTIGVHESRRQADLSACFLTTVPYGITGGIQEAAIEDQIDRWRIAWLRISSTHGWALPGDEPPYLSEALGAGTLRGGSRHGTVETRKPSNSAQRPATPIPFDSSSASLPSSPLFGGDFLPRICQLSKGGRGRIEIRAPGVLREPHPQP
jgi:hypothetical protein